MIVCIHETPSNGPESCTYFVDTDKITHSVLRQAIENMKEDSYVKIPISTMIEGAVIKSPYKIINVEVQEYE